MYSVNGNKVQKKYIIQNDIRSLITNIYEVENKINNIVSLIRNMTGGSSIGADNKLIGCCQHSLGFIQSAKEKLSSCIEEVGGFETREGVDDDKRK